MLVSSTESSLKSVTISKETTLSDKRENIEITNP
jgi:hypothetical protein